MEIPQLSLVFIDPFRVIECTIQTTSQYLKFLIVIFRQMEFTISQDFIRKAILNPLEDEKCSSLHPGSCNIKAFTQMLASTKSMSKVYFIIHLLPFLFKYKKTLKNPKESLIKFTKGYTKSMLFVASTLFLIRRILCLWANLYKFQNVSAVGTGIITGMSLLLQSPDRQMEMSLVCLNKGTEMLYLILKRRYPWLCVPGGDIILVGVSISILAFCYFQQKQMFRPLYQKAIDLLLNNI